jgi:hypothetical protein
MRAYRNEVRVVRRVLLLADADHRIDHLTRQTPVVNGTRPRTLATDDQIAGERPESPTDVAPPTLNQPVQGSSPWGLTSKTR